MVSTGIAFSRALQLQPFLKAFEQRGGMVGPVLKAAGLEHFDLADPATLITGNALYRAVHEMADVLDDPFFAARVAEQEAKTGTVFVRESYAVSHTLAEFLPLVILELYQQVSNIQYSLEVNSDRSVIRGKRNFTPVAPLIQADAAVASIWVTFLRLVVAEEFDPSCLLVTAQEGKGIPRDLVPQSSFLKRKWNGVQISFPSEWLRRPLKLDWQMQSTPRGEFQDASPREVILAFMDKVCRDRISERSFGMEDLARQVGVHPKSLQRTLGELGTSFGEVRDQARRKKAVELMASGQSLLNEEIAEALGFSSPASFYRAFKRWTGVTPAEFRKKL